MKTNQLLFNSSGSFHWVQMNYAFFFNGLLSLSQQFTDVFLSFWTTVATEEQAAFQQIYKLGLQLVRSVYCWLWFFWLGVWKHCQLDFTHCLGGAVSGDIRDEEMILGIISLDEADSTTVLLGSFYQREGTQEIVVKYSLKVHTK